MIHFVRFAFTFFYGFFGSFSIVLVKNWAKNGGREMAKDKFKQPCSVRFVLNTKEIPGEGHEYEYLHIDFDLSGKITAWEQLGFQNQGEFANWVFSLYGTDCKRKVFSLGMRKCRVNYVGKVLEKYPYIGEEAIFNAQPD